MRRRWLSRGIGVCIAIIIVFTGYAAQPVHAGTIRTVDTCTVGDTNSLDSLISQSSDGDTINFSVNCTGTNAIMPAAQLSIAHNVTIDGNGHAITIDGQNSIRVLFISSGAAVVAISNVTVTNGSAGDGGGILNFGTLTLNNMVISGNTASGSGGGVRSDGPLTLTNSTLSNNTASGGTGGGGAIVINQGQTTLTNVTISGNSASRGGGVRVAGGAVVAASNSYDHRQ